MMPQDGDIQTRAVSSVKKKTSLFIRLCCFSRLAEPALCTASGSWVMDGAGFCAIMSSLRTVDENFTPGGDLKI
jgi:hypothetical protein